MSTVQSQIPQFIAQLQASGLRKGILIMHMNVTLHAYALLINDQSCCLSPSKKKKNKKK